MNEELKVIISANIDKFKKNVNEAKQSLKELVKENGGFSAMNDEFQKYGDAAKKGLGVAATSITAVGAALLSVGPATAEYRQNMAAISTAFETAGGSAEDAKNTYNELYKVMGDTGAASEATQMLGKLGVGQQELSEWTNILTGVYGEFSGALPLEGLAEAVNHSAQLGEVQSSLADALEWSGVNVDEFNASLAECSTQAEREQKIRETLSGLYGESADLYRENNAEVLAQNEANGKFQDTLAQVGDAMAPINTMLTELGTDILAQLEPYITDFAENHLPTIKDVLNDVATAIGNVLNWIIDNWELVSTLAAVITAIAVALGVFSTVMGIVNAVMAASPVTWIVLAIVAAIAALIAIIVLVVKHWDDIKAAAAGLWEKIKEIFDKIKEKISTALTAAKDKVVEIFTKIKDSITEKINSIKTGITNTFDNIKSSISDKITSAKDTVLGIFDRIKSGISDKINAAKDAIKGAIDKIKGFFSFEFKWPKIKMPKFGISPEGWKIGDLLDGVIPKLDIQWNAKGGVFDNPTIFGQGIGEDGAEAVVPLEKNLGWLDKMAGMLADRLGTGSNVVLQVDGKTFGEVSISSINNITRQTGNLQLITI